jgi:hypothetical protein
MLVILVLVLSILGFFAACIGVVVLYFLGLYWVRCTAANE